MNVTENAKKALADGLAAIAEQFQLPSEFPPDVLADAEKEVSKIDGNGNPHWTRNRIDRTDLPLVTLDPFTSTDLDQAFYLEREGQNLILYYALADIGAFVSDGSSLEKEAWRRGVTIYGLNRKRPLYPEPLSQNHASLLPTGDRPAVLVVVVLDPQGRARLRSVDRILCRSRAKLAYDSIDLKSFPLLEEFAQRFWEDERVRGTHRVEFPQQEVVEDKDAPGGVRLVLRSRLYSESVNSTLSLAVNIALGKMMEGAECGLFRNMEDPSPKGIALLRREAHALGIVWHPNESLRDLQKRMDATDVTHLRFLLEARRSGGRAHYASYRQSSSPWHAAIGSVYVHATAPMRRLADRYVLDLAHCLAQDQAIPDGLSQQLELLPAVMERAEGKASSVDRAVIDLLEAVSLQHRVGETLHAEVVDADQGIVQTVDSAIRARALQLPRVDNGDWVEVRIEDANPKSRSVKLVYLRTKRHLSESSETLN